MEHLLVFVDLLRLFAIAHRTLICLGFGVAVTLGDVDKVGAVEIPCSNAAPELGERCYRPLRLDGDDLDFKRVVADRAVVGGFVHIGVR